MSAKKTNRRRIEIDVAFAPMPQALILDHQVSAQACRLWGVLFVFRWNDLQPEFDKLAEALSTTARSVYRWLQELEATGWIGWDRNADIPDRFTLHTTATLSGNDTGVNSDPEELIPRSKELIPRSKRLTPVSQELTQVSISSLFDPSPMPQTDQLSSDQKIQKIQNHGGGARAPELDRAETNDADPLIALFARYDITQAEPLARLYRKQWPDVTIEQLTRLCEHLSEPDAGSYAGARLYRKLKAGPYERQQRPAPPSGDPARLRRADKQSDQAGAALPERGPVRTTLDY